jgi:hypothetical protein
VQNWTRTGIKTKQKYAEQITTRPKCLGSRNGDYGHQTEAKQSSLGATLPLKKMRWRAEDRERGKRCAYKLGGKKQNFM